MNVINKLASQFSSRTVLSLSVLLLLLFVDGFKDVVVQVFDILPESLEGVFKGSNVPELMAVLSAWYFRVNPKWKA